MILKEKNKSEIIIVISLSNYDKTMKLL